MKGQSLLIAGDESDQDVCIREFLTLFSNLLTLLPLYCNSQSGGSFRLISTTPRTFALHLTLARVKQLQN